MNPVLVLLMGSLILFAVVRVSVRASENLGTFPEEQVVVVNGKGQLLRPVGNAGGDCRYTVWREMKEEVCVEDEEKYLTRVATGIRRALDEKRKVVIFVHGGLNTQVGSMRRASELLNWSHNDPAKPPYFVFINWQSSLLSSYRDRLFAIREAKDNRLREGWRNVLTKASSPFFFTSDLLSSLARLPVTLGRQMANGTSSVGLTKAKDIELAEEQFKKTEFFCKVSQIENAPFSWKYSAPSALMSPMRVLTIPLVDGFGGPSWGVMQRRTTILFSRELGEKEIRQSPNRKVPVEEFAKGPLYKLGKILSNELQHRHHHDEGTGELIFIGHSMGAILGVEWIKQFPEMHYDRIVFMAAACRVRDLSDHVFPYLSRPSNCDTEFYSLMLHPQAETRESNLAHVAPEGSLLVWIDQFFDDPDSVLDRTAGRYVNIGLNGIYLDQIVERAGGTSVASRIHFKTFPYLDRKDDNGKSFVPMKHGDFGDFMFWEQSFWEESNAESYERPEVKCLPCEEARSGVQTP